VKIGSQVGGVGNLIDKEDKFTPCDRVLNDAQSRFGECVGRSDDCVVRSDT
jgi:hypothetical protein